MANLDTIFQALSDKTRREILLMIKDEEFSVSELAEPFSISLPAVSKHLKILEKAGLITKTKQGRTLWIGLNEEPLNEAMSKLKELS